MGHKDVRPVSLTAHAEQGTDLVQQPCSAWCSTVLVSRPWLPLDGPVENGFRYDA